MSSKVAPVSTRGDSGGLRSSLVDNKTVSKAVSSNGGSQTTTTTTSFTTTQQQPPPPPSTTTTTRDPKPPRRSRSRRSNSDIPAAIFEHVPVLPAQQHYGSYHQQGPPPPYSYGFGSSLPSQAFMYGGGGGMAMYGGTSPHPPPIGLYSASPTSSPMPLPYPVVGGSVRRQRSNSQSGVDDVDTSPPVGQQQQLQQQLPHVFQQQVIMPPTIEKSQQQQRRERRKSRHRKSLSSNAATDGSAGGGGQYGAFWNGPTLPLGSQGLPNEHLLMAYHHSASAGAVGSPGGQQQHIRKHHHSGSSPRDGGSQQPDKRSTMYTGQANSFSPRNEFRKMLKDLSPTQQHRKSFHSGIPTTAPNRVHSERWSRASTGSAPTTVKYPSVTSVWAPLTPPPVLHPTIPMPGSLHGIPSPAGQLVRLPSPTSAGKVVSTEPVNLFQVGSIPSKESNRKKQIRQQSAQYFMESVKGVEQPLLCRNVGFLLLFVFHLLIIVGYLGNTFAHEALIYHDPRKDPDTVTIYYHNLLYISSLSGGFAIVVSTLLLCAMTLFARLFLQIALMVIITLSFIWGTIGVGLSPKTVVPVTGIIALGLAVAYAFIVWDRIPFSAANLLSALSGIRAFPGTVIVAILMQILALGWCIYFSVVCSGIYNSIQEGKIDLSKNEIIITYVLLGISFCWTYQVIHGCVESITAGVISSWWHTPDSPGQVRDSCFKTLFYSVGSICFGGLVIGPVAFLRQISVLVRPSQSEPSLMCLHQCMYLIQVCISGVVDSMAARFNAYSFTYIGMYQYSLWDAGLMATEFFEKRGWTTIVSDDLVPNVLFLTSLVMGGVTGCFAHLVSQTERLSITSLEDPGEASFVLGAAIGLVLSSIIFSVVSSAVNTVLVCFASSPVDFERNHPDLSTEMRAAWREVWPGALDVNDLQFHMSFTQNDMMNDEMSPLI